MNLQPTDRDKLSIVLFLTEGSHYQSFISRIFVRLLTICCLLVPTVISAADGDVDPTFKTDVTENNGSINVVAVQPDNRVLVGGFFEAFGGRARRGVTRLNADGTLDLTFDPRNSIPNALAAQAAVNAIFVQPDGNILVGVSYLTPGATPRKLIVRLLPDGTPDLAFNTNLVTRAFQPDGAFAIAVQADGKIIVGGDFRYTNGTQRDLARLHADGSIDVAFVQPTGGIGAINVRAVAIQPDGRIIVGGRQFSHSTAAGSRQAIWRLNSDGNPDTTFSEQNNPTSGNINSLILQPDGTVIAVGSATFSPPVPGQSFPIMRFSAGGARDASFTNIFTNASLVNLARQTDGKLIVVGDFQITNPAIRNGIARLNTDGTLDTSFSASGSTGQLRTLSAVGLQADGKAVPVGRFDNFNGSPAEDYLRLNTDGSRDASFVSNSVGYNGRVHVLVRQPDGKILVGIGADFGNQTKVNGVRLNGIARLNQDYSVDTTFASPLTAGSSVLSLALQTDGKILVSGNLFPFGSNMLLRLNGDGTVDAGFNPPPNLKNPIVQPDGRILAVSANQVVRLNSNGSLDNTFTANFSFPVVFLANLALQPDGKIVVGGVFTQVNSVSRLNIARLNTDGSVDTSFDPGTGVNDGVNTLLLRADGRVIIGGRFTSVNGTARNRLALLESNGSLNTSFVPANPGNMSVQSLAVQPDGKLLYGGEQLPAGSTGVYRLGADGSLDASFALGASSNQIPNVYAILVQTNGKIVAGGRFHSYNDVPRMSLVRLNPRNGIADFDGDGRTDVSVFRPSDRVWYILNSSNSQFYGIQWGLASDKLAPADYDGDGRTDIAIWREGPATQAAFWILQSSTGTVRFEPFGQTGDVPTAGDWDGDGKSDVSVYRNAAQSTFFYRGSLDNSAGNTTYLLWGASADVPVVGDYDGDERTDAAIFRPSNSTWYALRSSDRSVQYTAFGLNTDKFVPADYDGDGKTDIAVFRPSTGVWYIQQSIAGSLRFDYWGLSTDLRVPADYDGDGRADLAVFRNGIWYIKRSSLGIRYDYFGLSSDIPISLKP